MRTNLKCKHAAIWIPHLSYTVFTFIYLLYLLICMYIRTKLPMLMRFYRNTIYFRLIETTIDTQKRKHTHTCARARALTTKAKVLNKL